MRQLINIKTFVAITLLVIVGSLASVANANHAWGKYHWDKSTEETEINPLVLGSNLTAQWDTALDIASADWNNSVIKNEVATGSGNTNCGPTSGQVEICNDDYSNNGWLGITSIWATRGKNNHITQAVVKFNDYYFDNFSEYSGQDWKDFVVCHEVGHTFGLGHRDENFDNASIGSCMDYTGDPDGPPSNLHPDAHDYEELVEIYAHLNSTDEGDTGGPGNGGGNNGKKPKKKATENANVDLNNPSEWGRAIGQDALGRNNEFERELPNGQLLITHILWAN